MPFDIQIINENIILKSHLGQIKVRQNDMENYIYLCWIQMWGMTFWSVHEEEKLYRFNLLMKIIDKISNHEMEILNLIFESLVFFLLYFYFKNFIEIQLVSYELYY